MRNLKRPLQPTRSKGIDSLPGAVLYEVNITITQESRADFLTWLNPHVQEMLNFDGFESAEILIDSENDREIICHYRLRNLAAMNAYLEGPAKAMRADGVARFGGKMQAKRRILLVG